MFTASAAYRKAIELNPEDAGVFWNLGWLYYTLERWDDSIQTSRKGLNLQPDNAFIQFNIAVALLCKGDTEAAKKEYESGMKLSDSKSLQAAIDDLNEALEKYPDPPGAEEILIRLNEANESAKTGA